MAQAKGIKIYKRKRGFSLRLAIVVAVPALLFFWAEAHLRPVILTMAEAKARVMAVRAMNDAVFEIVGDAELYGDLMDVVMDGTGRVSMMQANTAHMNELGARAALLVQRNLGSIAAQGISVPLGAALGPKLLAGVGPSVQVRIVSVGAVTTEFVSEFTSAGINQTRHRIFLQLNTTVQLVIPTGDKAASISAQMPIAESIIVGDVPRSFIELAGQSGSK